MLEFDLPMDDKPTLQHKRSIVQPGAGDYGNCVPTCYAA